MANINFRHFTLGVEEEYMVIDPVTRELKAMNKKLYRKGRN
jgi:carboxylate-amine ligase